MSEMRARLPAVLDQVQAQAWRKGCEQPESPATARSAPAGEADLALIREMTELAVRCAVEGIPGVIGHDEDRGGELRAIEFGRIAGHKPFDTTQTWFTDLLGSIGQA